MMHIKLWVLLLSMSLLTACSKEEAGTEAPGEPTKEICFSLNAGDAIGLSPARAAASIDGMSWKLLCFSDEYQYLFEATGTVSADEVKVQVPKGQAFRFLMLFAADASTLPSLEAGSSYWDLPAYAPQLPLSDPMSLLVGKGEEDGTIRDDYRIEYLQRHIEQMQLAIDDGVQMMGYCPWSAVDLISTHEGFDKRYGFIYVNRGNFDLKDLRRIPKKSFYWYKKVIASNGKDLANDL